MDFLCSDPDSRTGVLWVRASNTAQPAKRATWPFFTAALLIVGAIGITVLEIAAHIIAAIAAPADAMTPIDERDRYVAAKTKGIAFLVLSAVVFITIAGLLLGMTSWSACQALVLAFVVGELVRYGAEIVYYRYGSLK